MSISLTINNYPTISGFSSYWKKISEALTQSFRWSTEKAPDPKQTLPPFSVRICPFFNPLPMQIGQYYHRHHCPQTPYIEQQYHNHHRHPPVKSPTLIERWKCRRWLKKVQSSRYFGANIQRLTCNRYVFALHPWYYYDLDSTEQKRTWSSD